MGTKLKETYNRNKDVWNNYELFNVILYTTGTHLKGKAVNVPVLLIPQSKYFADTLAVSCNATMKTFKIIYLTPPPTNICCSMIQLK